MSTPASTSVSSRSSKKRRSPWLIIIPLICLVGGLIVGWFFLQSPSNDSEATTDSDETMVALPSSINYEDPELITEFSRQLAANLTDGFAQTASLSAVEVNYLPAAELIIWVVGSDYSAPTLYTLAATTGLNFRFPLDQTFAADQFIPLITRALAAQGLNVRQDEISSLNGFHDYLSNDQACSLIVFEAWNQADDQSRLAGQLLCAPRANLTAAQDLQRPFLLQLQQVEELTIGDFAIADPVTLPEDYLRATVIDRQGLSLGSAVFKQTETELLFQYFSQSLLGCDFLVEREVPAAVEQNCLNAHGQTIDRQGQSQSQS